MTLNELAEELKCLLGEDCPVGVRPGTRRGERVIATTLGYDWVGNGPSDSAACGAILQMVRKELKAGKLPVQGH
jgi:hypothetical protein